MLYGLISDIHANLDAFDAVLAELSSVEAFLCLGDVVGYGPDPGACVERLRELPSLTCVVGNHDLAAVGRYRVDWFNPFAREAVVWTSQQLSPAQVSFLSALPPTAEADGAVLVHGALPEPMGYILGESEARATFAAMDGALCLIGHTHVAEYYRSREGSALCEQVPLWSGGEIALEPGLRYIANAGAIGQPRDGNPLASFGIFDSEARTIEVRRVPYDVEAVQGKMQRAGLPEYLVDRLARGR